MAPWEGVLNRDGGVVGVSSRGPCNIANSSTPLTATATRKSQTAPSRSLWTMTRPSRPKNDILTRFTKGTQLAQAPRHAGGASRRSSRTPAGRAIQHGRNIAITSRAFEGWFMRSCPSLVLLDGRCVVYEPALAGLASPPAPVLTTTARADLPGRPRRRSSRPRSHTTARPPRFQRVLEPPIEEPPPIACPLPSTDAVEEPTPDALAQRRWIGVFWVWHGTGVDHGRWSESASSRLPLG